jgi:cell division protein FtsQ
LLDLAELQHSSPIMFSLISELRIAGSRNSSFDLLLYPVHQKIPVRISPEIDRTLLSNIYKVLYVLNNEGLLNELEEIDFRSGEVVYVRKEE